MYKKRVEITIFVICVFCTLKCTKIGLRLIVMYVLTFLDLITFIFYIDSYVYFMVLKVSFNSYVLKCRLNTKTTRPTSFELTILSVY